MNIFNNCHLINCTDAWKSRLRPIDRGSDEVGRHVPHKCAAIFIDNSGVDVILGILPFAEHLLSRGTEVYLWDKNIYNWGITNITPLSYHKF